jgi:hypothetical protein
MSVLDCIKNNNSDVIKNHCEDSGCQLKFNGLSKYVILKGDEIHRNCKMCDCIIFVEQDNRIIIGVVELKSKTIHVNEVKEKLENGSKTAFDIIKECGNKNKLDFCFLVLHKGINGSTFKLLSKKKIEVNGRKHNILIKSCGFSFLNAI